MRLIIEIEMSNAAFGPRDSPNWNPGWTFEATRILGSLSRSCFGLLDKVGDTMPLLDANGNKVGTAELRRSRTRKRKESNR